MSTERLLPAGVLWDLDGTLIDSEPSWFEAQQALVERYGGTWTYEDGEQLIGNDLLVSGEIIRRITSIPLSPHEIVALMVEDLVQRLRAEMPWRPGALELLTDLRARNVPCAMVTMSYRVMAETVLAALPSGTFQAVITGDEVTLGKPHPEPYLRAAAALGLDPHDCVAIEDSRTGLASAEAAGVPVVAVEHLLSIDPGPGRVVLKTLTGVTPEGLQSLAGEISQRTAGSRI